MAKKKSKADNDETAEAATTATEEAPAAEEGHDHDHDHHDHDHDHDHDHEEEVFVEDPGFEVDYKGDCAYEVKVSVPPANLEKKSQDLVGEIAGEAEIPGFRPGRAPRKLVERKFAKHIRNEVESKLVAASFQRLVKQEDLRPLNLPDIEGLEEDKERKEGAPLEFTLKFEVMPRVELGDYKQLEVERPIVKLKKKDVDEAIDEMRGRMAVFQSLDGGVAAEGDQVIIDFTGTVDGEAFQGGSAENYPYILGTNRFFEEFEKVLLGASPGDELECDVTLPDNLPDESLRGKRAHFTIKVHDVKRKSLPELDDEFAKENGYEDVKDMRGKVEESLKASVERQSNQVAETRAVEELVEKSSFEIPQTMIQNVAREIFVEEMRRLYNERVPAQEVQAQQETMMKEAEEEAVRDIKRMVVLNKVGELEKITVTEDDFNQEMATMAAQMGLDQNTVAQYFAQGEHRSNQEDRIFRTKAMAALMSHVKLTDKELKDEEEKESSKDA